MEEEHPGKRQPAQAVERRQVPPLHRGRGVGLGHGVPRPFGRCDPGGIGGKAPRFADVHLDRPPGEPGRQDLVGHGDAVTSGASTAAQAASRPSASATVVRTMRPSAPAASNPAAWVAISPGSGPSRPRQRTGGPPAS